MTKKQILEALDEMIEAHWECCDGPDKIAEALIGVRQLVRLLEPVYIESVGRGPLSIGTMLDGDHPPLDARDPQAGIYKEKP